MEIRRTQGAYGIPAHSDGGFVLLTRVCISFRASSRKQLRQWGKGKSQYYNADATDLEIGQVCGCSVSGRLLC